MYLLATREFADLASRDEGRAIFRWLATADPGPRDLFVSAISIGIVASSIEDMPKQERGHWRRLLAEARRLFVDKNTVVPVDLPIVDTWASDLRGLEIYDEEDEGGDRFELGEGERLVIAVAIARGLTLVSQPRAYLDEICDRTTLTIVNP